MPRERRWQDFALYGGAIAALLLVWQLGSGRLISARLLPPPTVVLIAMGNLFGRGELGEYISVSLYRVLVGYGAGCATGILVGVLMGQIRFFTYVLDPIVELFRPIPPVALIPLSIMWFGIDDPSRFFIISWATFFTVLINTAAGVAATPPIRIRAARCLGASKAEIFWEIMLPSALPYVLTGMRIGFGFAFSGLVAAEMIAAQSGIGFLIMQSRQYIQTDQMFVGLLTLAVVGMLSDRMFRLVIARTMRRYMQYLYNV